ncbi:MAG: pseudaminic acid biosynthesis-associated methylase [Candidatus Promineifilaceae bacterium]|jgi:pseudaminic acid biosynthesis-associated methylase
MSDKETYATEQEAFWAGNFGTDYIERNQGSEFLASNLYFFSTALKQAGKIGSALELGTNVGMNLRALQLLYPGIALKGVEINPDAAAEASRLIGEGNLHNGSIFDYEVSETVDLTYTKGVMIHIDPAMLPVVYAKLYDASRRFILVAEYYSPNPEEIPCRGHEGKLFKRDFAGEMLDTYPDLELVDYGFSYYRDPAFSQGDITWFLLRKTT